MGRKGPSLEDTGRDSLNPWLVLESLDEPLTVIAPDYRVVYVNAAARRLFGMKGRTAADVTCHEISHHRDSPCSGSGHPCPMEQARAESRSVRVCHEHFDSDGRKRIVEIIVSPVTGEDGSFLGVVESQRDVTEREEKDRLLKSYAEKLRESNQVKDLFIDIMSHDLLGPVSVIRGAASLALVDGMPGLRRGELDMIHRNSGKMISLIKNASVFARLQDPGSLSFEPAALDQVVGEALEEVKDFAARRDITFAVDVGESCRVKANPLLRTVFANLFSNAVKYGPDGSTVTVSAERRGGRCIVSVADRGGGVPDEDKEEIFTRFSRLEKKGVQGSGLGLAIVKRVVALHGGRCWVEDHPGGGSIFRVELEVL